MPDFTDCKRLLGNAYAGANGKKIGIEYQGEQYMLKFPPLRHDQENETVLHPQLSQRTSLLLTLMQHQHCFLYGDDFLLHLLQFSSAAGIQNFFTGILYCIHHDVHWWKDPQFNHSYHMRNISWAKFSSLADPSDEFIVANTHWSYRTEHANGNTFLAGASQPIAANELRDQCRMETYGMLESIRQKHSETPTFLLGDFNTSLSFFTQSGWTPPYFHIISDEAMHAGTALAVVPDSGHFDHLFGTGNYTISRYEYVKNVNFMELLTDHPFAYADLIF